jgi:hypothetical protein
MPDHTAILALGKHETIVGIVPTPAESRTTFPLVHVTVMDWRTQQARIEYLTQEEWTPAMQFLFSPGAAMCAALMNAVPTKKVTAK